MTNHERVAFFQPFVTRTEVRNALARQLAVLTEPGENRADIPDELATLVTGSDREVMQSYLIVKSWRGKGRSDAARIGAELRELFAEAIERMKQLPAEALAPEPIEAVRQVRRI